MSAVAALSDARLLWQRGEVSTAMSLLTRAMLCWPRDRDLEDLAAHVWHWRKFLNQRSMPEQFAAADGSLYLQPLGHHHAAAFAAQYVDTDVAWRCCLPEFEHDQAWHEWLYEQLAEPEQALFAVMSSDHVLMGCVSVRNFNGAGFVYYWLGPDYRGYGYAGAAVATALACVQENELLTHCFAKVFDWNTSSLRTLERLGFWRLPVSLLPPNDDELLFCLGAEEGALAAVHHALDALGASMAMWHDEAATQIGGVA